MAAVNHAQGFSDGAGRPFGWGYAVTDEGECEIRFFATPEVDEKLVTKEVTLGLTLAQLAALAHDVQAARNHALERQAERRREAGDGR